MKSLVMDLRYSLRVLLKSPGFTIVAIVTLAIGISANSVVFGMINALIIHPLNLPEVESLYQLERGKDKAGNFSYPDYLDFRDRNHSFDQLMAYEGAVVGLDTGANPSSAWIELVSGNYFDGLRLQPHLGRLFHASDERGANSAPYIVLTYSYWHTHFQDDPGVVGRIVRVNKQPYTIVGVAPVDFHGTLVFFSPDFFVPMVNNEQLQGDNLSSRSKRWVFALMGHLKPGVSQAQAIADLNSIGADLEKSYPKDDSDMKFALARPSLYGDYLGPPIKAFLTALMVLAGLILLAACTNLGSLFAARAADRSREVALKLALGSSRKRIIMQLFIEAMLISLVGGAVGLVGGIALLRALSLWQPFSRYPVQVSVNPDANVYIVTLLLAVASAIIFGSVPVRQILRTNTYEVIKAGPTGVGGRRITLRDILLVLQIAICSVLVTSSLVAVRGLVRSMHSNFGFEPQNAILANTDMSMGGYKGEQVPNMERRMIDAMQAIPGVETVGLVSPTPLYAGSVSDNVYTDQTSEFIPATVAAQVFLYKISPEYFHAAGTSLLAGRTVTWHDDKQSARVAVVNAEFARKLFGSVTAGIGRYYKVGDGTRIQVVGVVEQGKYRSVTEDAKPAMFFPFLQAPSSDAWLVVRSNRDSQQLASAIRSTLLNLDSGLPVYIQTWTTELKHTLFAARIATLTLGVLGVIAAMLCITGIFGTAAYSVSKRMKDLGIRIALGAERKHVLFAALAPACRLLLFGSVVGLVLGILATRVLSSIVYQATPRDPMVLAGVVIAMSLLGLLATWIPAQRALAVDPLKVLRTQ